MILTLVEARKRAHKALVGVLMQQQLPYAHSYVLADFLLNAMTRELVVPVHVEDALRMVHAGLSDQKALMPEVAS